MSDIPTYENFGSSENLLRTIQEWSDDIVKAVIYPPNMVLTGPEGFVSNPIAYFFMMLYFSNGDRKIIRDTDAELVLNDGIFNRMNIKIEFFNGTRQ